MPSGGSICKIGIAVSRKFKAADGSLKEEVTFIDVDAFGRHAEVISKYFSKGKPIFIEGRLKLDQWETQSGEKRNKMTVVLENFQFVGGKEDAAEFNEFSDAASQPVRVMQPAARVASNSEDSFDDDVPF